MKILDDELKMLNSRINLLLKEKDVNQNDMKQILNDLTWVANNFFRFVPDLTAIYDTDYVQFLDIYNSCKNVIDTLLSGDCRKLTVMKIYLAGAIEKLKLLNLSNNISGIGRLIYAKRYTLDDYLKYSHLFNMGVKGILKQAMIEEWDYQLFSHVLDTYFSYVYECDKVKEEKRRKEIEENKNMCDNPVDVVERHPEFMMLYDNKTLLKIKRTLLNRVIKNEDASLEDVRLKIVLKINQSVK